MDSLTQIALGAAVGEATLGRRIGNRAMLWGAICGTLPDLDVFVPLGDAVRDFTYHRSATHSLLVLALVTPLVVWVILRVHPATAAYRRRWHALVYLAFATHVLLDSFTVYGTQIFWPVSELPVAFSSLFIIDPLYTVWLVFGVLAALVMSRESERGHRLNAAGLVLSSAYLAWTVGAKLHVEDVARASLARQGIAYERLLTVPAPLNSLLWRVLAVREDAYFEGVYSLLDDERPLRVERFASQPALLLGLEDHWPVQRLQWFTRGLYSVSRRDDDVVITDLRMGLTPDYVFRFKVGEIGNPHAHPVPPEQLAVRQNFSVLGWVWRRIWSQEAERGA